MTATYTVHWVSSLTGNRNSSGCKDKAQALREARALFQEGAKNIRVCERKNGISTDLNWQKTLRSYS